MPRIARAPMRQRSRGDTARSAPEARMRTWKNTAAPAMRAIASAKGSTPPPPRATGFIASFPSTAPTENAAWTTIRAACARHDVTGGCLALSPRSGQDMRDAPGSYHLDRLPLLDSAHLKPPPESQPHDEPSADLRKFDTDIRRELAARGDGGGQLHVRGGSRRRRERATAHAAGRALRRVWHCGHRRRRGALPRVRLRHARLPDPLRRPLLRSVDAAAVPLHRALGGARWVAALVAISPQRVHRCVRPLAGQAVPAASAVHHRHADGDCPLLLRADDVLGQSVRDDAG